MRREFTYPSCGRGKICAYSWEPDGEVKAVLQIVHGIAEHSRRYDEFASFLNDHGILVVSEDHMGHGKSWHNDGIKGYFHGGWFSAVEDTYTLMQETMKAHPSVPYILFGHSMGSFMARTLLAKYPDSGIAAAIICGTAWQPNALLRIAIPLGRAFCKNGGDKKPCPALQKLMFGSYNARVEHPRTVCDWLSRDPAVVDLYMQDSECGFVATAGLYADMLVGIDYIQKDSTLAAMNKDVPVLFVAGREDPVGSYGKGVTRAAQAFGDAGVKKMSVKLYSLCRHEILNEINRKDVYADILEWIQNNEIIKE